MTARYKFIPRGEKQRWIDIGWKMDAVFSKHPIIVMVWPDLETEPKEPK